MLTIFTPTYNRAHTLPRLFESLKSQTCKDFEWLVIDDGSSDNTEVLFSEWLKYDYGFNINYVPIENGGKNRAINKGIRLARGQYFMILDSDDMLTTDAVEFICEKMREIENIPDFIGVSGKKADMDTGLPVGVMNKNYSEEGYTDCSNLERGQHNLGRDMAEVFITEYLRKYEFKVWPGEKFTPEEVVWNRMALDGYKLRWFNKITYLCEYQPGGLSNSTWSLLKNNPMGYAMMFNIRLEIYKDFRLRITNAIQYGSCCFLAGEHAMITKSHKPWLTLLLSPLSWMVAWRRRRQIGRFLD